MSSPRTTVNVMPVIYRAMLIASAVVLIIYGIEDGRDPVWGQIEQAVMLAAGLCVMWVAWKPSRRMNVAAGYLTTIAVMFEVVSQIVSRDYYRYPWVTASALWLVFGAYTVALIAFQWVREPPR